MKDEKQATMAVIQQINAVEGFDPAPLAVEYTDLNTNEKRLKLPVMGQLAWFWLKHPDGRVAVSVTPAKDCFVATARIYSNCSNPPDQYLAEATASRGYLPDKPTVSPREWAQTAAIGRALQYAGFGLQFAAAGDAFDTPAVDELSGIVWSGNESPQEMPEFGGPPTNTHTAMPASAPTVQTPVNPLEKAMSMPCPISKFNGKTLGDVLREDPKALVWVANKFSGDPEISAAAKLICEQAMEESA